MNEDRALSLAYLLIVLSYFHSLDTVYVVNFLQLILKVLVDAGLHVSALLDFNLLLVGFLRVVKVSWGDLAGFDDPPNLIVFPLFGVIADVLPSQVVFSHDVSE